MSTMPHEPRKRTRISKAPRSKLTIRMDAEHDGAIPLTELADIARTVQRAVNQIARSLNDSEGGGRPPEFLRKLSALEAVGIQSGSAVLEIEAPHDTEQFPIDFGASDAGVQAIDLFVASLNALSSGEDLPPEIGKKAPQTIRQFVGAFGSSGQVQVRAETATTTVEATLRPTDLAEEEALVAPEPIESQTIELVGKLYEANLREGHYRIEDEAGKTRYLTLGAQIDDQDLVRSFFGEIVAVSAIPGESDRGRPLYEVQSVRSTAQAPVSGFYDWSIEEAAANVKPISSLASLAITDLDEEDGDAFWRAMKDGR